MSDEKTVENFGEDLGRLRDITRMTGLVHEAQLLQLKMWPHILFQDLVSHVVSHDSETRTLNITMVFKDSSKTDMGPAVAKLEEWVGALLGFDWILNLNYKVEGTKGRAKVLHKGRRREPMPTTPPHAAEFRRYLKPGPEAAAIFEEELGPIDGSES